MRSVASVMFFAAYLAIASSLSAQTPSKQSDAKEPEKIFKEFPLWSVSYDDAFYKWASVTVMENHGTRGFSVDINNITVKMRTDGKDFTSVALSGFKEGLFDPTYDSAVIMVPVLEDVKAWEDALARWRAERKEYEELNKPRRVLPPKE